MVTTSLANDSINVAQLLKEPTGSTRQHELKGTWQENEDSDPCHLSGSLLLTKTEQGVWVSGKVDASVEDACSRCLVPFTTLVSFKMDDIYLPTNDVITGAHIHYDEEAKTDTFAIDHNHVLDLHEAIRQYRIAATPVALICKDDCKGLCPRCGADLNEAPCDCEPAIDPRWEQLREFFASN